MEDLKARFRDYSAHDFYGLCGTAKALPFPSGIYEHWGAYERW
jgi:hypothetical protein